MSSHALASHQISPNQRASTQISSSVVMHYVMHLSISIDQQQASSGLASAIDCTTRVLFFPLFLLRPVACSPCTLHKMSFSDTIAQTLKTIIPPILAFELLLGGQARITPLLTPSLYHKAIDRKAVGTRDAFYPLIPIHDAVRHSKFIGVMMVVAGLLVARRGTREAGAGLTLVLTSKYSLSLGGRRWANELL